MATIKEIAALAGVSRGTVDRVINKRGVVNKETERRVLEIAKKLNYTPNRAGRTLAVKKKSLRLGMIMFPPTTTPFFYQIQAGANKKMEELREYGVQVETAYGDYGDPTEQDRLLHGFAEKGVDGIALCGFDTPETRNVIAELSQQGIPVVTFNTDIPDSARIAYVGSDYWKSGRTAARLMHLFTGGKARVGTVYVSHNIQCHRQRVDGFLSYARQYAPGLTIQAVLENYDDDFRCYDLVRDLCRSEQDIDALFVASGGILGACRAVETLPVEERPKIICYDRYPQTEEQLKSGLIWATICQQPEYQGSQPLELLFDTLALDISPAQELYHTKIEILVSENVS